MDANPELDTDDVMYPLMTITTMTMNLTKRNQREKITGYPYDDFIYIMSETKSETNTKSEKSETEY